MTIKVIGYIYLDEDDVIDIHNDQLAQFGGVNQASLTFSMGTKIKFQKIKLMQKSF